MSILILLVIVEECFQIFTIECVASCGFATYDTYFVEVCFIYCNKNMLSAVLSCSAVSISLRPHGLQPARLLCPWEFSKQEYQSGLPCPSSRGSSQPRHRTQVPCFVGRFFTNHTTREALTLNVNGLNAPIID